VNSHDAWAKEKYPNVSDPKMEAFRNGYIRDQLMLSGQRRTVQDDDYFFKTLFPSLYEKVEQEKQKLDADVIKTDKYTGDWLINTFNLKPGRVIGQVKDFLNKKYGDNLDNTPEEEVVASVKQYLSEL